MIFTRKVLTTLLLSISLIFLTTATVDAQTHNYNSIGKSFKKKWQAIPIDTASMTVKYGYNTLFLNEDYIHTYHETKKHKAYVKNTARSQEKDGKAGKYAKVEIRHDKNGGTVYYRFTY